MDLEDEITSTKVFDIDIKELAKLRYAQGLDFTDAGTKLTKVQDWLKEAYSLNYKNFLSVDDVAQISSFTDRLASELEWLRVLDFSTITSPKEKYDAYVARVNAFHNEVYSILYKVTLPLLRDEIRRDNPDQVNLEEELKKVVALRGSLEKEVEIAKEEASKIRQGLKNEATHKGNRSASALAIHFENEIKIYSKSARIWLGITVVGYLILFYVVFNLGLMTFEYLGQVSNPEATVSVQEVWLALLSKVVILATLWYALSFMIKNYNVNSHLVAVNRHRAAVAKTLADFIVVESQQSKPRLSEMLQNATNAMFKNAPIGYVTKNEKESSNPVLQIVNDVIGASKP